MHLRPQSALRLRRLEIIHERRVSLCTIYSTPADRNCALEWKIRARVYIESETSDQAVARTTAIAFFRLALADFRPFSERASADTCVRVAPDKGVISAHRCLVRCGKMVSRDYKLLPPSTAGNKIRAIDICPLVIRGMRRVLIAILTRGGGGNKDWPSCLNCVLQLSQQWDSIVSAFCIGFLCIIGSM